MADDADPAWLKQVAAGTGAFRDPTDLIKAQRAQPLTAQDRSLYVRFDWNDDGDVPGLTGLLDAAALLVPPAETDVRHDLWHHDLAQQRAVRGDAVHPGPDGGPQIALAVQPDPIGTTRGDHIEHAATFGPPRGHVENPDMLVVDAKHSPGIGDTKQAFIRAEAQAIAAHEIGQHRLKPAIGVVPVDVARQILRGAVAVIRRHDPEMRIAESDRAIRFDHDTIGRVERFALIAVSQRRDAAIPFGRRDPAAAKLATDQPALKVAGATVGKVRRCAIGRQADIRRPAHDLAVRDVGKQQAIRIAHTDRSFGPVKPAGQLFQRRVEQA